MQIRDGPAAVEGPENRPHPAIGRHAQLALKRALLFLLGQPAVRLSWRLAEQQPARSELERSKGLTAEMLTSTRTALANAERASGNGRRTALTALASQLNTAAEASSDQKKVKMLASTVTDLGAASR